MVLSNMHTEVGNRLSTSLLQTPLSARHDPPEYPGRLIED